MQELILIGILALVLWPAAMIGVAVWVYRQTFGRRAAGDEATDDDTHKPDDAR